jgi:DNA-directed RNA polymerase subunit beta'
MLSSNNILSPAHGAPLAIPTQDMVLGAYYLTYGPDESGLAELDPSAQSPRPHVFRTAQEAEWSYEHGVVKLHDLAEYRPAGREGGHVLTTVGRIIYNDKIERALEEALGEQFEPTAFEFINRSMKKKDTTKLVDDPGALRGGAGDDRGPVRGWRDHRGGAPRGGHQAVGSRHQRGG